MKFDHASLWIILRKVFMKKEKKFDFFFNIFYKSSTKTLLKRWINKYSEGTY